ncbi:hypothetical protein [Dapis sp. BLCC M229]|uniref:hypothetical protein n=1 Tax=Dapis sp. BLCC M229 TaxID=3400188 RepID=UPI003CEE316E
MEKEKTIPPLWWEKHSLFILNSPVKIFHFSEDLGVQVVSVIKVNLSESKKIFVRKVSSLLLVWKKRKQFHSSGRKAVLTSGTRKK